MTVDPVAILRHALPDLRDSDLQALSEAAQYGRYKARVDLTVEGEIGHTFYVLAKGEADVIVHSEDGQEILVDTIGPNTYFGEMAFFGESTRMATIRTKTPVETLEIDEEDFMRVAQANPSMLRSILKQIIGHLRRNDRAVIKELNAKNTALQQAYTELSEQEELRTKFIATLSHELRTPLTSLQGFVKLINQGAIVGESLRAAMSSIGRNVDRLVGLTNDLLMLYEMHPTMMNYSYLNLADVVVKAMNAARAKLDGVKTAVTLDFSPDVPEVYGDHRSLLLALQALIENAFTYNPQDGPVCIRVRLAENSAVAVDVIDQGIGIPEAAQQQIFDAFFRVEREGSQHLFPGLGIGLTIARFAVERHQGQILVDSQPDQGSTFTVILPIHSHAAPAQNNLS